MKICVTSLSGHRIDELLADYISIALRRHGISICRDPLANKYDLLLLTNGLNDSERSEKIIQKSKKVKTLYFYDDWTLPTFEHMTTISQFTNLGDKYFQISELAVFDSKFETANRFRVKRYDQCYWGHQKQERLEYYKKYIKDHQSTLLIGEWDQYTKCSKKAYERDMKKLYMYISLCKWTPIFGDEKHNGTNIPLRIYEALMNGVIPLIDKDLIGDQNFKINEKYIISDLNNINEDLDFTEVFESIIGDLEEKRSEVSNKLMEIIKC